MNKWWNAVIIVILWLFLISLSTLLIFDIFNKLLYSSENLSGTFSTLLIGVLAALIATYWNSIQNKTQETLAKGALSISVTPENVIELKNNGNYPIKVLGIKSAISHYERSFAKEELILQSYNHLKNKLVKSILSDDIVLSQNEKTMLPIQQTGIIKPIEEYDLVLQIIGVKYSDLYISKTFIKYFGLYRLTGPFQQLLYTIGQKNGINFRIIYSKFYRRFYPEGLLIEYLKSLSTKPDDIIINCDENTYEQERILNTIKDKTVLINALEQFDISENISTDRLPQDKWYLFKIEEE